MNYQYEGLETLEDFIRWGATLFQKAELFFGHGTDNAFDDAKFLALYSLKMPWEMYDTYRQARLTLFERQKLADLFQQRIITRKPSAYLTGEMMFAGLKFFVNENTLVPRSPIAELIARKFDNWVNPEEVYQVLDLCTGSGCIGIAALQALPNAEVDLVDLSPEALEVAQKNIELYNLEGIARAIQSDLYAALAGKKYDLILSNPPYVDQLEMDNLPAEYLAEPQLGLAAGEDGLDLVRHILADAAEHLTENGVLILEVGVSQYYLEEAYPELPFFWFDFEQGGEGVLALNRSELEVFADILQERRTA